MSAWAEPFARWLINGYVDATIVLAASLLAMHVVHQPARRLALGRATLLGLLALPLVGVLRERSRTGPGVADGATAPMPAQAALSPESWGVCGCALPAAIPHRHEPRTSTGAPWHSACAWAFAACGAACTAWLLCGCIAARRMLGRAEPAPKYLANQLRRVIPEGHTPPRLTMLDSLAQPIAVGALRPTIVLPRGFVDTESPQALGMALAHEWAHIRGGDLRMRAALRLLLPILFAHPLYWWLRTRVREDQEARADDEAGLIEGRLTYAGTLLNWARRAVERPCPLPAGALGLWPRPSLLRRRVGRLLAEGGPVEPRYPKCWAWACAALALAGVLLLCARPALSWDRPLVIPASLECEACLSTPMPSSLTALLCPDEGPSAGRIDATLGP